MVEVRGSPEDYAGNPQRVFGLLARMVSVALLLASFLERRCTKRKKSRCAL